MLSHYYDVCGFHLSIREPSLQENLFNKITLYLICQ